jgi:hypothetical protein
VTHPLGIASGEVIVDGDQLGILAREGVQVERQRGDEGLALTRGHLGDATFVERDAADQLDIEVHHVPGQFMIADQNRATDQSPGGIFYHSKRLGQDLVQRLALLQTQAELVGLGAKLVIGQRLVLLLELVDTRDDGAAFLDVFPMVSAGKFLEDEAEH